MSQAETLASHWVLLFFLGLLNKHMLAWSVDYAWTGSQSSIGKNQSWSGWTSWSQCSRTCGGGLRTRTRVCNARMLRSGRASNPCVGETVEHELCFLHNCSPFDKEFLEYQCSLKNGESVGGKKVEEWIPYRNGDNPCELQCLSGDKSVVRSFGKAVDGTKCATGNSAVCVNGRCTPVDCAGRIGTASKTDRCGVCRGDNSTCVHVQDVFWRRPRLKTFPRGSKDHYDYEKIVKIPAGATEILVKEYSENNFLALVDHKGHYHLNGNYRIQYPGHLLVQGSEFIYTRTWDGGESLSTAGPLRSDVFVHVLGSGEIPTVRYEYWTSSSSPFQQRAAATAKLNQLRQLDDLERKRRLQPENFHLHNFADHPKRSKSYGHRSYYHRNEVLKSVPSWSIKRHSHRKSRHGIFFPNLLETRGTDYMTEGEAFAKTRAGPTVSPSKRNRGTARTLPEDLLKEIPIKETDSSLNVSAPVGHDDANPLSTPLANTDSGPMIGPRKLDRKTARTLPANFLGKVPRTDDPTVPMNRGDASSTAKPSAKADAEPLVHPKKASRKASRAPPANLLRNVPRTDGPLTNPGDASSASTRSAALTDVRPRPSDFAGSQTKRAAGSVRHGKLRSTAGNGGNKLSRRMAHDSTVDEHGRPTSTLAQTRGGVHHRRRGLAALQFANSNASLAAAHAGRNSKRNVSAQGECLPCPKPKQPKRHFCASDFVLRATLVSCEKKETSFRYEMDITRSYRNKVGILPKEYIWTMDTCQCPKLRVGKEYIVMGFSGTAGRESRLYVNRTSFVRKYSERRARGMLRLARDYKTLCKK